MKYSLRFSTLFLAVLMLFCFVSCASGNKDNSTTTSADQTTTQVSGTTADPSSDLFLTLVGADSASSFVVVRPDTDDKGLSEAAITLRKAINEKFGSAIGITNDWVKNLASGQTVQNDAYEILVGDTNRAETAQALAGVDMTEFVITAIGNKLVIAGHNAYATQKAVEAFIEKYLEPAVKGEAFTFAYREVLIADAGSEQIALHQDADLRIMTLNVNGSDNEAEKRYDHIYNVVMKYLPDIMCFQECNKAQYTNVINRLRSTYTVACQYHQNGSTYIYTPILFRKDKYELVDKWGGWLDGRYTGTNTKSITYAVLKVKETGKTFCVINMHGAVCSNTYTGYENKTSAELAEIANQWRKDNVRQMLELHDTVVAKHGDMPFLFTADYNFTSDSVPYSMVTKAGLVDAETAATVSKMTGTKTTHTVGNAPAAGKSIDHVFYYPDSMEALVHFVGREGESELRASDHLLVYADVKFK